MSKASSDSAERRRSLLIVSCLQFGVHTDTTKYCEHLRDRFELTYLCLDTGLPRHTMDGVEVVYCDRHPLGKVELGLFLETLRLLRTRSFDLVFLRRTKFSFFVRLLHSRVPMIFDIRSGSIESNAVRRRIEDGLTWFNSLFFRHITVISPGLATDLRLPRAPHVLPLGGDRSPVLVQRRSDELRVIYVGTFKNRRIDVTIRGLRLFLDANRGVRCRYTLIGFGPQADVKRIREAIEACRLEGVVSLCDRIEHDRIGTVLAENDIGIAFTPRTPWYEHQPSTKVFEYIGAGLLCVATDNAANREVIDGRNGVLVEDTDAGVCAGLTWAAAHLTEREPEAVADTIRDYSWAAIVENNLLPYIEEVMG